MGPDARHCRRRDAIDKIKSCQHAPKQPVPTAELRKKQRNKQKQKGISSSWLACTSIFRSARLLRPRRMPARTARRRSVRFNALVKLFLPPSRHKTRVKDEAASKRSACAKVYTTQPSHKTSASPVDKCGKPGPRQAAISRISKSRLVPPLATETRRGL